MPALAVLRLCAAQHVAHQSISRVRTPLLRPRAAIHAQRIAQQRGGVGDVPAIGLVARHTGPELCGLEPDVGGVDRSKVG